VVELLEQQPLHHCLPRRIFGLRAAQSVINSLGIVTSNS
jgi:hypothetical protein